MTRRIGIVGASGLVGGTLVERLVARGSDDLVALIHSSGNAWRLTRLGIPLRQVDVLSAHQLESALDGCTHVVNCSRGDDTVMTAGLVNLLNAVRTVNVGRFVHLSSVAVYGDPPPPASTNEDAPTNPAKGSYGWVKLRQDELVAKAAAAGLCAVTLCPPNIGGPYSTWFNALVGLMRSGEFALLDGGAPACNVVDVANLSHAIELALDGGPTDGRRLFITDAEPVTWYDVAAALAPLAGVTLAQIPSVTREQIARARPPDRPPISIARSLKHLVSADVRRAMRQDPLWERLDSVLRSAVARMGSATESRVRRSVQGPRRPAKASTGPHFHYPTCAQQLRGVRHSSDRAKELLGYVPPYTFTEGVAAYSRWYRAHHGLDTEFADLIRTLS